MVTILGAGLAGLSVSYHLGHENCHIFEQNTYAGGHIHSEVRDGFTWDEGPHVSFTKHDYVRELFAASTDFLEYPVFPSNYYKGTWIAHPAQTNLYALPEAIKQDCIASFLDSRRSEDTTLAAPTNYQEWLELAFGKTFANTFPKAYTEKYWTTSPKNLTTDWVGARVYYPNTDDVLNGAKGPLPTSTHYITSIRYPKKGGYFSFAKKIAADANISYGKKLSSISFSEKTITFSDGSKVAYEKLVNTIPLPILIQQSDAPIQIKEAASKLSCSSVILVNVVAAHDAKRSDNWIYVYDKDKYSSRINFTELLSPENGLSGQTGIQVEVYFSKYTPLDKSSDDIAQAVCAELIEMGLVESDESILSVHSKSVEWANVIFDKQRKESLNEILAYLTQYGLLREEDDLQPSSEWDAKVKDSPIKNNRAQLFLAGRFGQWKYYWTDDCVLRGKFLSQIIG
ncbi:MAG: protoporphyrinogen/coproporphyrinogen oxidase [Janthinobacterium lividum]